MMQVISPDTQKILALSALQGVGAKTLNSLVKLKDFKDMPLLDIAKLLNVTDITISMIDNCINFAQKNIDLANKYDHKIISFFDVNYPLLLKKTDDAPAILYCAGDVEQLNKKSLAVIGTREPTEHGVVIARNITEWFASSGWNIISGLAKGVDTIAHKTALRSPSKTIAVMAQGLEKIYPAENKNLATEIVTNGGLLISEYPYNSTTYRNNFVQRDRIQAGLSSGVIMVQSDINGGSLHASRAILKYGRYLIVPNQSDRDINNSEPKIQANMLFSRMNKSELLNILKTNKFDINKIIIMKNKSEYAFVDNVLKNIDLNEGSSPNMGFGF